MTTLQSKIHTIRSWLKRCHEKGKHPNGDEIWARIHKNWPTLNEADKEKIFQES